MNIIVDKEAGFCFGVKRSVDLAFAAHGTKKVQVLGELIHNRDFISDMAERGIETVLEPDELDGEVVIIRAHGLDKNIEAKLRKKFEVVDATCPFVKNIQLTAEKLSDDGYKVIILGEQNHPEVIGILSYAPKATVVSAIREVPDLAKDLRIALISQTTQNEAAFDEIADFLTKKYPNTIVKKTICDATRKKQSSINELARDVEVMIVVGGKNSCNTKNLYNISKKYCESYHIENESELEVDWFNGKMKVGVTAGASTPDYIIDNVKKSINEISKKEVAIC